jgi:Asp-tRNA(Asn)/Glu-tRNA(Gln) amidotransferase C subunit/menaquinone-dependent protoporphyrinogen IX oxidase
MQFDFGFSMYFLEGPELSRLEQFFIRVQDKLQIYQRHTETTVQLYHEEYREQMSTHKSAFGAAMKTANEAYKRHYDEINGSDDDKHQYAMHEAGIQEIEYHFANAEEALQLHFTEMADHFNKSALVTLYALLETELRRLCGLLQKHFNRRVSLDRFEQSDYLKSIMEYIDLIIEMDTTSLKPHISKIEALQFLRNRIMHNGGEFPLDKQEFLEDLVKTSDGGLTLEEIPDEQTRLLRVKSKYLLPFYDLISELFREAFRQLNGKMGFTFLAGRLTYLFRFLAPDADVIYLQHKAVKNGHCFVFRVESKAAEKPFAFSCNLTIATATKDELIFTNQLEQPVPNLDRLIARLPQRVDLLPQIFAGFLTPGKKHRIEFMLYPSA